MHRSKVDPGVSELPQGNELSQVHVNSTLVEVLVFRKYKNRLYVCVDTVVFNLHPVKQRNFFGTPGTLRTVKSKIL